MSYLQEPAWNLALAVTDGRIEEEEEEEEEEGGGIIYTCHDSPARVQLVPLGSLRTATPGCWESVWAGGYE